MNSSVARQISRLVDQLCTVIVGKRSQIEDCVACLLAGGHLLIEDVPGVGKTTLAHTLAVCLGLKFSRVQFTADLMPSDLIGVSVFERSKEAFVFHPGPVFAQVLLADEINRAGPKTQSALLEAMEEQQVSVENETRALPQPFFVIATQNPSDQLGTYALPESQLDRFLLRITLGYPDRAAERALLVGEDRRQAITRLPAMMSTSELRAAQQAVREVVASDALLDYLQALIAATRSGRWFVERLQPAQTGRAGRIRIVGGGRRVGRGRCGGCHGRGRGRGRGRGGVVGGALTARARREHGAYGQQGQRHTAALREGVHRGSSLDLARSANEWLRHAVVVDVDAADGSRPGQDRRSAEAEPVPRPRARTGEGVVVERREAQRQ